MQQQIQRIGLDVDTLYDIIDELVITNNRLMEAVQEVRFATGGPAAVGPFGSGGGGVPSTGGGGAGDVISGASIIELVVNRLKVIDRLKIPAGTDKFGSTVTLRESYTESNSSQPVRGASWSAQSFTPKATFLLTTITLKVWRFGSPGTVTVGIRANASDKPTGPDLALGTFDGDALTTDTNGEEATATMTTPVEVAQGTVYHIVVRATAGNPSNYCGWRVDTAGSYTGGQRSSSQNSGVSWGTNISHDHYFKVNSQEITDGNVWIEGDDLHFFDESGVEHAIPLDVISKAFLDAKGDLITASADDTPSLLSVGANGDMLVPNSDAAGGLEWVSIVTYEDSVVVHEGETVHV